MSAPHLSACLIVRDEAECLESCLVSLRDVADEIVVVDTGSADDTVAIALDHGARVEHFAWCDDFAAARNAALDAALGHWVLSIDADEQLTEGGARAVAEVVARGDAVGARLVVRSVLDDGRHDDEAMVRVFRRRPDVRWRGRIHEQVTEDLVRVGRLEGLELVTCSGVALLHDGYTDRAVRAKDKRVRNLRLLERSLADDPDDDYLRAKLAAELGPHAGAAHRWEVVGRVVARGVGWIRERPWTQALLLNAGLLSVRERESVPDALELGLGAVGAYLEAFGPHPVAFLAQARVRVALGQPADALAALQSSAGSHTQSNAAAPESASLHGDFEVEVALVRADAFVALGRPEAALEALLGTRATFPAHVRIGRALIRLALSLDDAQSAIELGLEQLASGHDQECAALVAEASARLGRGRL